MLKTYSMSDLLLRRVIGGFGVVHRFVFWRFFRHILHLTGIVVPIARRLCVVLCQSARDDAQKQDAGLHLQRNVVFDNVEQCKRKKKREQSENV